MKRVPVWLRALIPAVLIAIWLAAGAVGGPYFGRVDEVSSNDQTSYLPASAEATQVQKLLGEFSDSGVIPAIVLFSSDDTLTTSDQTFLDSVGESIGSVDGVADGISPAIPSDDGKAVEFVVPIAEEGAGDTVEALRTLLAEETPDSLSHYVTGPAGFTADLVAAFAGIDGILLLTALAAVFLILLIVYRSPAAVATGRR